MRAGLEISGLENLPGWAKKWCRAGLENYAWLGWKMMPGCEWQTLDKLLKPDTIRHFLHPESKYGNMKKGNYENYFKLRNSGRSPKKNFYLGKDINMGETLAIRYFAPNRPILACVLLSKVKQRQRWYSRADKDKDKIPGLRILINYHHCQQWHLSRRVKAILSWSFESDQCWPPIPSGRAS